MVAADAVATITDSSLTGNEKLEPPSRAQLGNLVQRLTETVLKIWSPGLSYRQWNGLGSGWTVGWKYDFASDALVRIDGATQQIDQTGSKW